MTSIAEDHRSVTDRIQANIKDIRGQYGGLTTSSTISPSTTSLEHLATLTRNLQVTFQSNSSSLPAHDQRILSEALTSLTQDIAASIAASKPRAKFSFSKKPVRAAAPPPTQPGPLPSLPADTPAPVLRRGERISIPFPATAPSLSSLERCVVSFPFSSLDVATAHVRDARQCILMLGKVDGAVLLTGLTDCIVVVAARQFRLHRSQGMRVFLRCGSDPIIEDCEDVAFARLPAVLMEEDGMGAIDAWDRVQDFSWLADGVNPHWRRLGEHEDIADDIWQRIVETDQQIRIETALEAVGLRSPP